MPKSLFRSHIKKLLFLPVIFLLISCKSSTYFPNTNDISSASLTGDLKHVQYWDEYDNWDVSSLSVDIVLKNASNVVLPITDSHFSFTFSPEKPSGNIDKFSIIDLKYTDANNNKYLVTNEITFPVLIVPYPYSQKGMSSHSVIVLSIVFAIFICLLLEANILLFDKEQTHEK